MELEKTTDNTRVFDENINHQTIDSEKNQLQESLQNTRTQLQIAEIKLQISEVKNQMANEKLNKLESISKSKSKFKSKSKSKSKGKMRDSKRTKKSL